MGAGQDHASLRGHRGNPKPLSSQPLPTLTEWARVAARGEGSRKFWGAGAWSLPVTAGGTQGRGSPGGLGSFLDWAGAWCLPRLP